MEHLLIILPINVLKVALNILITMLILLPTNAYKNAPTHIIHIKTQDYAYKNVH